MRLTGVLVLLLFMIPVQGQQQSPSRGVNFDSPLNSPQNGTRSVAKACCCSGVLKVGTVLCGLEKEAALGRALAGDFRRRAPSVQDEHLRTYISQVAARLNQFTRSPFPLTIEIHVGTDQELDAVGLPGGYLFVPLKLLASAQDEPGLAGTLAHAIAHIAARHSTRQATRGEIANSATGPLIFMGGCARVHTASLIPLGFRKFQEENEAQADRLAMEWMTQSGFADGTFETGEFAAMRERARALAGTLPKFFLP